MFVSGKGSDLVALYVSEPGQGRIDEFCFVVYTNPSTCAILPPFFHDSSYLLLIASVCLVFKFLCDTATSLPQHMLVSVGDRLNALSLPV